MVKITGESREIKTLCVLFFPTFLKNIFLTRGQENYTDRGKGAMTLKENLPGLLLVPNRHMWTESVQDFCACLPHCHVLVFLRFQTLISAPHSVPLTLPHITLPPHPSLQDHCHNHLSENTIKATQFYNFPQAFFSLNNILQKANENESITKHTYK